MVQFCAGWDGSSLSALSIVNGFRRRGWKTRVVFGNPGEVADEFRSQGIETQVLPHKSWLRTDSIPRFLRIMWQEMRNAAQFRSLFADRQSELVYINTATGLCAAVAARRAGLPCIWHMREQLSHVGGELKIPGVFRSWLPSFCRRHAQEMVFNTEVARAGMIGEGGGGKVIPIGVPDPLGDEEWTPDDSRRELGLSMSGKIIGVPGGLRPVKGHDWFFRSVAPLMSERDDLTVAVAGDGDPEFRAGLDSLVAELGIQARVKFLGAVKAMGRFYRACDLICIPSRSETFGRCAVEAMACQTPVVASRVGGLATLVRHEQNGLSVPFGSVAEMTNALGRLLDDRELAGRCVVAGRADYGEHFGETVYQDKVCDLADEVWTAASLK
ncbi:MAG: glycosyltransferase family 4 protein [Limisphaerales bacterium]